jgi:hypothetical protein
MERKRGGENPTRFHGLSIARGLEPKTLFQPLVKIANG